MRPFNPLVQHFVRSWPPEYASICNAKAKEGFPTHGLQGLFAYLAKCSRYKMQKLDVFESNSFLCFMLGFVCSLGYSPASTACGNWSSSD